MLHGSGIFWTASTFEQEHLPVTSKALINRIVAVINRLPKEKAAAIADFIMKQCEEHQLTLAIQKQAAYGDVFAFLNVEDELYNEADLKEKYNN